MSTDMELEGDVVRPQTIELYGVFGEFRIENSSYLIRYVSTFANPTRHDGHGDLVDELKPMRDRVKPADLRDLRSLLQRDLSDRRVASELVPYLKGLTQSGIGFFPAILAVIVPKDYLLDSQRRLKYPIPVAKDGGKILDYGGCWSVEYYRMSGQQLPLGLLRIVSSKTDIVVLDGQHRANAFRYVSGRFRPEGTIYQTFYRKLGSASGFAADLPVTLIWFEGDQGAQIEPILISRKLFVDVNNTARPVSLARTYLLDDRRVSCIGTQEFYNFAASRGYEPGRFSLLHSAFDMDVDLARSRLPCFALTAPEIIEAVLQFALLGSDRYNSLATWKVDRLHRQRNVSRFRSIWSESELQGFEQIQTDDEDEVFVGISDPQQAEKFRELFRKKYLQILVSMFDGLELLKPHYQACEVIPKWVDTVPGTTLADVWKMVFCGGEGLYWAFRDADDNGRSPDYRKAIKEIEDKFIEKRSELFGEGDQTNHVYEAFVSKAFQIGFVMAIDYLAYADDDGERLTKVDWLLDRLNSYSNANWVAVITELWPLIRPSSSTDPKAWPAYRNVLLRMYDNNDRKLYSAENLDNSPDWHLCDALLKEAAKAIFAADGTAPTDTDRKQRAKAEIEKAKGILGRCGLAPVWGRRRRLVINKADERLRKIFEELQESEQQQQNNQLQ